MSAKRSAQIIVASTGDPASTFKTARLYHIASRYLADAHRRVTKVPPNVPLDQPWLDAMVGETVLEALAIELILKARLLQAGISTRQTSRPLGTL